MKDGISGLTGQRHDREEYMNLLIRSGLIGGAIGGEAMVLLVLVNTLLLRDFANGNFSETQPGLVFAWGIAYPLLVILVFEIGGIFSSWLCRDSCSYAEGGADARHHCGYYYWNHS